MRHVRPLLFVFAFSLIAGSAFAGLSVSPGTPAHTHSDANTGGDVIAAGSLRVTNTIPQSVFIESDATADNGRWQFTFNNETFYFQTVNDVNTVGPVIFQVERTGTVVDSLTLATTLASSKSCAAGHTRSNPNYCYVTAPASTNLVRDACTAVTAASADAKVTHLLISATIGSANAIATRTTGVSVFSDATCATLYSPGTGNGFIKYLREFAAVAAGTIIGTYREHYRIPLPSTGATIYLRMEDDAGDQGTAAYFRMGYGD